MHNLCVFFTFSTLAKNILLVISLCVVQILLPASPKGIPRDITFFGCPVLFINFSSLASTKLVTFTIKVAPPLTPEIFVAKVVIT